MKDTESIEIESEAEVNELLLTHSEFCVDVRMLVKRGTSYRTILTWLETAIRKSTTKNNGFIPVGMTQSNYVANYYSYLADHADQFNRDN